MSFNDYYEAKNKILSIIEEDILGPVYEDEIIPELPVSYYIAGRLFPQHIKKIDDEGNVLVEDDLLDDEELTLGNTAFPSALGMTFAISKRTEAFDVNVNIAYYEEFFQTIDEKGNKAGHERKLRRWRRHPLVKKQTVLVKQLVSSKSMVFAIHNACELQIDIHSSFSDRYIVTVTLINRSESAGSNNLELSRVTYFQPHIMINHILDGEFVEMPSNSSLYEDQESQELELLYHNNKNYAFGHGCSVDWNIKYDELILESKVLPQVLIRQLKPAGNISKKQLSMKYLSQCSAARLIGSLLAITEAYDSWIRKQEEKISSLDEKYIRAAKNNIEKCRKALSRLSRAVELLDDPLILRAFQLANEAMLEQRKHTIREEVDETDICWYPFQLAFVLQELPGIVDSRSSDRNLVDLLWFPTGGGKTEAYLGIAAFTLFYRRLKAERAGFDDDGVAVIMRYTLRLLSLQQFERATSMICAAELIRQREKIKGRAFGIGLWAGQSLTPNRLSDVEKYLDKGIRISSNPVQIKKCPWCQKEIKETDYKVDKLNYKMQIICPNPSCDFHKGSGLPVFLVDEEIYKHKPCFLIGTIDKFAQVAYKEEAGELIGYKAKLPPELIIQDELHLLSGPLGTVTGLFEAAISKICENNGIKPKVIASTATIRNAQSQVKELYGKDFSQFPPQGISADDSFFASLSTVDEKPARTYMGIMAYGSTKAQSFSRVLGALLFASRYLADCGYSEEVIDAFWTETIYFNNLKELGTALVRILDNVQDYYNYLRNTKFKKKYQITSEKNRYTKFYELTSRNSSSELGNVLQKELLVTYKKDNSQEPYDFLVASNMISVGVDVARLGNMVVVGQPIKTTEYIQATSRVGRSKPGIVLVLYHPSKTRDRSHYEQFRQFHSEFYKHVEPTSLTPFADRARDRGLQALYCILCRYMVPVLFKNHDAANYRRDLPELDQVRNYIYDYVAYVDPEELDNLKADIEEIEIEWENLAAHSTKLVYNDYSRDENSLYKKDYMEGDRFRMMNSMRDVEPDVNVVVEE